MLSLLASKGILAVLGAALIASLVGAGYLSYRHTLAQVQALGSANAAQAAQLDRAQAVNAGNLAQVKALEADAARATTALAEENQDLRRRLTREQAIEEEIAHAPAADDGPVAPVLRRALDGLRGAGLASAAPAHAN